MPVVNYDWDELEDNIVEEYDENGNTIAEYTTKPELYGDVISQHRNGQSHFFHHDGIGNTTEVTDINGNVTDTRQYTAFGEITESTGTTVFPFQFVGQKGYFRDEETASYSVRRRPYEPVVATWMAVDPFAYISQNVSSVFSMNHYCYVGNNSPNNVDPSGLIAPAVYVAIKAFMLGEAACIGATGGYAFAYQESMGLTEKEAHCYASCMISRNCGRMPAWMAGYLNELVDELQEWLGAAPVGFDWDDILANATGRSCSGWETIVFCGMVGRWFRQSCFKCCKGRDK